MITVLIFLGVGAFIGVGFLGRRHTIMRGLWRLIRKSFALLILWLARKLRRNSR
jgi:hypothetical protein